ncbi:rootletin isoform X2 [Daktulosphaira vitifoliae]|nr:rootletin isoform X2 [Daktulosphaira vitifoliae]
MDLIRENQALHERLRDESARYERRLDTYKLAQQRQAVLVSRLQAKVMQYRERCTELEREMRSSIPAIDNVRNYRDSIRDYQSLDLDSALRALEQERTKSEKIMELNSTLREQLDDAQTSNETLTADLQKLTSDWEKMRDEMNAKEDEWKEEEQMFNDYCSLEHGRMMNLWQDVAQVKRMFNEMKSSTQQDLNKLRGELSLASNEMVNTCSGIVNTVKRSTYSEEKQYEQIVKENNTLQNKLERLQHDYDNLSSQLRQKEMHLEDLKANLSEIEDKYNDANKNELDSNNLRTDVNVLMNGMQEIIKVLQKDKDIFGDFIKPPAIPHFHLSSGIIKTDLNIKPVTATSSFVDSTLSAVQAIVYRYQTNIHELQVQLSSCVDKMSETKKHCEQLEVLEKDLQVKIDELGKELDECRSINSRLNHERDSLTETIERLRNEAQSLQKNRMHVSAVVENMNEDYDKVQKTNAKLQKLNDTLEDEKMFQQGEIDRLLKEIDLRILSENEIQDRCSCLKEELISVKEELNQVYLDKDLLEQRCLEFEVLQAKMEKIKGDLESEIEKLALDRTDCQESLAKAESLILDGTTEKQILQKEHDKLSEEKKNLQSQVDDLSGDLIALRKEILQMEQDKQDLNIALTNATEKWKALSLDKEKLETELEDILKDRTHIEDQLSNDKHKRKALNEEIIRLNQKLDHTLETNSRLNNQLQNIFKENEQKQIALDGCTKQLHNTEKQLSSLHGEKENLEAILYDIQNNLEVSENRCKQIEREKQDLLIKQETMRGEIHRLCKDIESCEQIANNTKAELLLQYRTLETEFQQTIDTLKKKAEEDVLKLINEKEALKNNYERKIQDDLNRLGKTKDNEIEKLKQKLDILQKNIETITQQHDEALLRAENEKQQTLLLVHRDQKAIISKLENVKKELEGEKEGYERSLRETRGKLENEKGIVISLREQLAKIKNELNDMKMQSESEKRLLIGQLDEIQEDRDKNIQQCMEVKSQLAIAEDKLENLHSHLNDTNRRLKESESVAEHIRKELMETRRNLNEISVEKEKYLTSNKELREIIKRSEIDKREQGRTLEEAIQKITLLDEKYNQVESERMRLNAECKDAIKRLEETEKTCKALQEDLQRAAVTGESRRNEQKQLQTKLDAESEERERACEHVQQLKRKVNELEGILDGYEQEVMRLRHRIDEDEMRWKTREQELLDRLEDEVSHERKLEDQKHNLEVCLSDQSSQIQDLKCKLGTAESRLRSTDTQLTDLERNKKDVENRLSTIWSTLKRVTGMQADGSVRIRKWSPSRMLDGTSEPIHSDGKIIDPEVIKKGARNLMQQVAQVEREKDDYKSQIETMGKQLEEIEDIHKKTDTKLNSTIQVLRRLQDDKVDLESKLSQKQSLVSSQAAEIKDKSDELKKNKEILNNQETIIYADQNEKMKLKERLEKLKVHLSQLETEKIHLQDELTRTESKATKLEIIRIGLDGDLQRLQMMLQEKDSVIEKLEEKCENHSKAASTLEERCASLNAAIERLNTSLAQASVNECDLKAQIQALQRSLHDASISSVQHSDKYKQLQRALQTCENEKKIALERLDIAQHNLADCRRDQLSVNESILKLQMDLENKEVQKSHLEAQLRALGNKSLPRLSNKDVFDESTDLKIKLQSLNDKVYLLESEKRSLEKKALSRSKSFERVDHDGKYVHGSPFYVEHRELKTKCEDLEKKLYEKEQELKNMKISSIDYCSTIPVKYTDLERYRAGQLQAERMLEAREQSHRQQIHRLENQVALLRDQLAEETKRRQAYINKTAKASREAMALRQALDKSLTKIAQDPSPDATLLKHEAHTLHHAIPLPK